MADKQTALEAVYFRNEFYRHSYKQCLLALVISFLATIGLGIFLIYERTSSPMPSYFATNQDGSLKIMIPLNLPYLDDQTVLDFTAFTVKGALSADFLNYRSSLQNVRTRFTPKGYENFINALTKSANLRTVLEKKFALTADFVGPPTIVEKGVLPSTNTYAWRVQIPINLHYVSSEEEKTQPVTARVTITRVSSLLNEYSIAVASLIVEDRVVQ